MPSRGHVVAFHAVVGELLIVGEDPVFAVDGGLVGLDVAEVGLGILAGGHVAGFVDRGDAAEDDHLEDALPPHIAFSIAVAAVGIVGSS